MAVVGDEVLERPPQRNQALGVPSGELTSKTVQQHVTRARRPARRRRSRRGLSEVKPLLNGNVAAEERPGRERVKIGGAR